MPRKVKRRIRNEEGRTKPEAKKKKVKGGRGRYFNLFHSENVNNPEAAGILHQNLEKKTNKLLQMVLDIPLVVITQVVSDIKEIENLAEKKKIPLRRAQSFLKEETESSESQPSGWMLGGLKRRPAKTLDFIPLNSNSKKSKKYDNSLLATSQPRPVESKVQWFDFISLKPETKCENNSVSPTPKPVVSRIKNPPVENLDFISFKSKAPSKFQQVSKYERNPEPIAQPSNSRSKQSTCRDALS